MLTLIGALVSNLPLVVVNLGHVAIWLSDYTLWVDTLNKPRRRRESLSERLQRLFAVYRPAYGGARG